MKNIVKSINKSQNKNLKVDSKAKIYVPIQASNIPQKIQRQVKQSSKAFDQTINELRRTNMQLKQKEQIYIDKLIKLEEGLEKQHSEFMRLQDLYNELFISYKSKEEEIAELQQKYRQSNRKKESLSQQTNLQQNISVQTSFKKQIIDQKQTIDKLEVKLGQYVRKIQQLQKTITKLQTQATYFKNKQKMNDSRASLNSKVFQQLEQWQKLVDIQKEEKIKLQYQNNFLKVRNNDLQTRICELQQFINQKQSEVMKLRQSNIFLSRQNSQNRLSRSASRSPQKQDEKENSSKKIDNFNKTNKIIQDLHVQNKMLKKEIEKLKQKMNNYNQKVRSPKNQYYIRQQQFFSFSREGNSNNPSNHSSNQDRHQHYNKELIIKIENQHEVEKVQSNSKFQSRSKIWKKQQKYLQHLDNDESLQELPPQLQIEKLIMNNKKKQNIDLSQ